MEKNKKNNKIDPVRIKKKNKSDLAEFTRRPLPTQEEIEKFEDYIENEAGEVIDDDLGEEIEEGLNEIYQDDDGRVVDVKKMSKARRRGFFFWLFNIVLVGVILAAVGWFVYNYFYLRAGMDVTVLDFSLSGETEIVAGGEAVYIITYRNPTNIPFHQAQLEVSYPDKFIVLDTYPLASSTGNSVWEIGDVPPLSRQTVKIKGMMLAPAGTTGVILANLTYMPANFSSQFRKEATLAVTVKDIGLDFDVDYLKSALVGEDNEVLVRFKAEKNNFIHNFRLLIEPEEDISVATAGYKKSDLAEFNEPRPGVWTVREIKEGDNIIPLNVIFGDQATGEKTIKLIFETLGGNGDYYQFEEKDLTFEVLKSDLNLALIINGSRQDQGVDFGQILNYSIVYNNKGETDLDNVAIMAVLESDFLDWASLDDKLGGRRGGSNTIIWTKEELPALATVAQHDEGTIDFSIKVKTMDKIEPGKDYAVKSYAQFSVGDRATSTIGADNKSNTIINKINSDLNLNEEVRYFNDDNITVGNGPLPLRAGGQTSFKIYWTITNTLHELEAVKVIASLPPYVSWDDKSRATVGSIYYDAENHRVVWDVGRMPASLFRADAEFNFSVVPTVDDVGKIIVLKPGSRLTAKDIVTGAEIVKITDAKTSKLEDDKIAQQNNDGVVRE